MKNIRCLLTQLSLLFADLEKNNDIARATSRNNSNHKNTAIDILQYENLQRVLSSAERQKRAYTKRKTEYWQSGILERGTNKRLNFEEVHVVQNYVT